MTNECLQRELMQTPRTSLQCGSPPLPTPAWKEVQNNPDQRGWGHTGDPNGQVGPRELQGWAEVQRHRCHSATSPFLQARSWLHLHRASWWSLEGCSRPQQQCGAMGQSWELLCQPPPPLHRGVGQSRQLEASGAVAGVRHGAGAQVPQPNLL